MHFDTATRQRWMSVLAHSEPQDLLARMQSLQLAPEYELIRTPETGLVQLQARMGGIGDRFFAGDATLTRAAVRLADGTLGYSWILGRDRPHAERCAAIDALLQSPRHFHTLMETLITPLEALRSARIEARRAEVNASRVDFFTTRFYPGCAGCPTQFSSPAESDERAGGDCLPAAASARLAAIERGLHQPAVDPCRS